MSEFETLRYLITQSKEVIAGAEILLDKATARMEELYTGNWATPNEFFTRTQAKDCCQKNEVKELMLEYSMADAELHLLCCEDVGRYPTKFLVKDGIIAAIKDGSDMMPWAIY